MSKFLTYEDRLVIAQLLQENASFGVIGKKLGKDRTTIAKEIKRHSYDKKSGRPGYPYNPCKHRSTCKAKKLCGNSCTHQSAYKCSLCLICTPFTGHPVKGVFLCVILTNLRKKLLNCIAKENGLMHPMI